jgi:hypothetical protein
MADLSQSFSRFSQDGEALLADSYAMHNFWFALASYRNSFATNGNLFALDRLDHLLTLYPQQSSCQNILSSHPEYLDGQ